jgi:hypothetical protein
MLPEVLVSHRFVLALSLGLAAVLFVAGCQRPLSVEKTVRLLPGDVQAPAIVDAPRAEQKIRVSVTSAEPINVDVLLEANRPAVMEALQAGKRPAADKLMASKEQATADTLSVTVPAGKEFAVVLSGSKKETEVKLSVKSE